MKLSRYRAPALATLGAVAALSLCAGAAQTASPKSRVGRTAESAKRDPLVSAPLGGFGGPEYAVGRGPNSLIVEDVNGDGNPDIIVANTLADADGNWTVSVLLGRGDGTFGPQAQYAAGLAPNALVAGDFNGDGKPDLAVADVEENAVSVLIGNGDGTFQAPQSFAVGDTPLFIAAADFNRDGKLDVVVSTFQGDVVVLLGKGDGTLGSAQSYSSGGDAEWILAADFNHDGIPDLALVGGADLGISILLGKGDGTFPTHTDYGGPYFEEGILSADLNADGNVDLVVPSQPDPGKTGAVGVFLGKGDGTFSPYVSYEVGSSPVSVVAGDFNGDGLIDLATVSEDLVSLAFQGGMISVLLGNGDGTFQTHVDTATNESTNSCLGAADFNRDGKLDIAAATGYSTVNILLQAPISLSQSFVTFANQNVGSSSPPQSITLTNGGTASVSITGFAFTGSNPTDFSQTSTCGASLGAGQACTVGVTFAPLDFDEFFAFLNISTNAPGSPLLVSLIGFGESPQAVLSPTSLVFPTQPVQRISSARTISLTNEGSQTMTIGQIAVSGDFREQNSCPKSLAVFASCTITVAFDPTASGLRTGVVTITDNAPHSPQTISLSGTGTFALLTPASLYLGIVKVGQSATQPVTLKNLGTTAMTIHNIYTSGPPFTQTNNCGSSLAAGAICTVNVTFTPTRKVNKTGTLYFGDSGGGSPQTLSLSGTGD
jgi:hypothetical protein